MAASAIAFTMMYIVVPNRRVRPGHALTGGVLAALLFEAAKHTFAVYITEFPTYEGDLWCACHHSDLSGLAVPVLDHRAAGRRSDALPEYLSLECQ